MDLYDEFGNYVGPDIDEDDDVDVDDLPDRGRGDDEDDMPPLERMDEDEPESLHRAVILHEDKSYYRDADDVFKGAEVTVQEEDTMSINEPILKRETLRKFQHIEKAAEFPPVGYSKEFMEGLMTAPELVRNVAIIGHLGHGKTAFTDMLVQQTHNRKGIVINSGYKNERFTDTRFDEQERGLSIKAMPVSIALSNSRDKSYLINFMDTPGHVNFADEATAAMRLSDGVIVIVDACEGVMLSTEHLLRHAVQEQQAITVVLNKVDRLILELKLPPVDAYFKLKHTLDEINEILEDSVVDGSTPPRVSPELNNVCFAAGEQGWSFTLRQFAQTYTATSGATFDVDAFARRLWGDIYFNPETRGFVNKNKKKTYEGPEMTRTFIQFIMEPLYKIYAQVVGEESAALKKVVEELGLHLTKDEYDLDVKPLLRIVLGRFFGGSTGLVDMLVQHVPSPVTAARRKVEHIYTGPLDGKAAQAMFKCDPKGPLMIQIAKLYPNDNAQKFFALGRVFSGTIKLGERVKVLGETFSEDNDEDQATEDVIGVYTFNSRYKIEHSQIPAGNWCLLEGVDASISKTATITTDYGREGDMYIFKPLRFNTSSIMKIAVEPLNPSELPKMIQGLRMVNKSYPILTTKAEESGEHVIIGTGELFLDSVMHDLRKLFTDIEIKVSDPVVTFCETVTETSSLKCYAESNNHRNKLTVIAEPLDRGLAEDIENEKVSLNWDKKKLREFFSTNYDWDILAARNIWAFGPDQNGPNILAKDSIVQGFQWASKEGPLCEEPIRNVKFKILHAVIAEDALSRSGTQVIPTSRRVAYSAFLTATPRLMEPMYQVEMLAPLDVAPAIYKVLARRRGHVTSEKPKPGTPLYIIRALLPVIDSFGFETDLRTTTQGHAFGVATFDHWAVVPGDPLDKSIILRPLEPASMGQLARDFMVKTRRRKGLSEDVAVTKFFDDELLQHLQSLDIDMFK